MAFTTALLYPPIADFTQPHPAIPYLASFLRARGEKVLIKDINLEAHDAMLSTPFLETCYQMIESKFETLDNKPFLQFSEHALYKALLDALGADSSIISNVDSIKKVFKEPDSFYDYDHYFQNVEKLKQALQIISSAYHPMIIEPCEYTTPYFLTSHADILEQCQVNINPLIPYYQDQLLHWLEKENPDLIGFSVTYPTQILQMFAMAHLIRSHFPNIHLCAGGAFISQMTLNMQKNKHRTLFQYLDSIILYEGESALYHLIQQLKSRQQYQPIVNTILYDRKSDQVHYPSKNIVENLDHIPPPDYDGYPLNLYLSPKPVLPYAPTRGCYWNRCAFCHYGATQKGTARYREKKLEQMIADLDILAEKYNTNHFAFSVDVMAPKTVLAIAKELIKHNRKYLWSTDIKIDDLFTRQNCQIIKQGGCLSVAIGLESACQRILELMDKGISPHQAQDCIHNLSSAGISTQIMTFLNFPTETAREAMETIQFIRLNMSDISLFTMGDFVLHHGSKIFENPEKYGIDRIYFPKNDDFKLLTQYTEKRHTKSERDKEQIESAYADIAVQYAPQDFPFVGGVSNNHTLLYFERFGKDILKQLNSNTDDTISEPKTFKRHDIPVMRPEIKAMAANYCLSEIEDVIERNPLNLEQSLHNRQINCELNESTKTYPQKTMYLLIQSMNWLETPQHARFLLQMCNGKNTAEDIINMISPNAWDMLSTVLNSLYSYNVLDKKQ